MASSAHFIHSKNMPTLSAFPHQVPPGLGADFSKHAFRSLTIRRPRRKKCIFSKRDLDVANDPLLHKSRVGAGAIFHHSLRICSYSTAQKKAAFLWKTAERKALLILLLFLSRLLSLKDIGLQFIEQLRTDKTLFGRIAAELFVFFDRQIMAMNMFGG